MAQKLLCECRAGQFPGEIVDADFEKFDTLARQCGYPSGIYAANNCVLWGEPVDDAVQFLVNQLTKEVSDG